MAEGMKRKVRLKLHELSDVEVNYVSLVPRGANRLPFKVLKHDKSQEQGEMIHLTKKDSKIPHVVGYAIKSGAIEHVMKVFEKEGIKVIEQSDDKGGVVVAKVAKFFDEDKVHAIAITKDVAVLVRNLPVELKKEFCGAYGSDFSVNVASQGFYPGLMLAYDALSASVGNALYEAHSVKSARSTVDKALTDFHGYVLSLVDALPSQAFKIEKALKELSMTTQTSTAKADEKPKDEQAPVVKEDPTVDAVTKKVKEPPKEKPADMSDEDYAKWQERYSAQSAKKDDAAPEKKDEPAPAATTATAATPPAPGSELTVQIKMEDVSKALTEALAPFNKTLEGLANSVQTINSAISGLQKRVEEVDAKAQAVEKAVKSTVTSSGAPAGDSPAKKQTQKGESVWKGSLPGFPD